MGTSEARRAATYPSGTLFQIGKAGIFGAVQISHFTPPTPPEPRSGRSSHASRSVTPTRRIRLVIGDSDGEFRRSLRNGILMDPGMELVGETDDGEVALALLRQLRPDVALLDEDMPAFGGAAIARVLRTELPDTRVVVMTRKTEWRSL